MRQSPRNAHCALCWSGTTYACPRSGAGNAQLRPALLVRFSGRSGPTASAKSLAGPGLSRRRAGVPPSAVYGIFGSRQNGRPRPGARRRASSAGGGRDTEPPTAAGPHRRPRSPLASSRSAAASRPPRRAPRGPGPHRAALPAPGRRGTYGSTGTGVRAYGIDGGIHTGHGQFGVRTSAAARPRRTGAAPARPARTRPAWRPVQGRVRRRGFVHHRRLDHPVGPRPA